MNYYVRLAYKNNCYKAGKKLKPKGVMLHSIGCAQPDAQIIASKWNSPLPDGKEVCCHGVLDTQSFYQTLPFDMRGWHGGGKANNTHIGIEMTEPDCICYKGGADYELTDTEKARKHIEQTYNNAVQVVADLCVQYKLDPLCDGVVISHSEGYKRGVASNHADVEHLWDRFGFSMDGFRKSVEDKIKEQSGNCFESSESIVNFLHDIGVVSNTDLWYKKLNEDVNAYWLAKKAAEYIKKRR